MWCIGLNGPNGRVRILEVPNPVHCCRIVQALWVILPGVFVHWWERDLEPRQMELGL